jgi:hypothetical protein
MALRLLFILEAVVDLLFGVAFVLAPGLVLSVYGMSTDATGTFLTRFLGAVFIGYGILTWAARDWSDTAERRLLIRVTFVTSALGFLVSLQYQLQPGSGVLSSAFVVLTALFGLAWGWFAAKSARS